jgi:hypothetical protein
VVLKDATIYFPFKFPIKKHGKPSHGRLAFPIVVYQLNQPLLDSAQDMPISWFNDVKAKAIF